MSKIHIGKNGPAPCKADKRACRYRDEPHYDNMEDAQAAYEERLVQEHGGSFGGGSKKPTEDDESTENTADKPTGDDEKKEIQYSFLKVFKEQEAEFEENFGDYPKRFFSTNLRMKGKRKTFSEERGLIRNGKIRQVEMSLEEQIDASKRKQELIESGTEEDLDKVSMVNQTKGVALSNHLISAASAPADNNLNTEDVREKVHALAAQIGPDAVVTELDDEDAAHRVLKHDLDRAQRAWVISYNTDDPQTGSDRWAKRAHVVVKDTPSNDRGSSYQLRREIGPIGRSEVFVQTDVRGLAGDARITHNSDSDSGMLAALATKLRGTNMDQKKERSAAVTTKALESLAAMEESQLEGQNFLANRKYVRDNTGKVATAFDDKKNPDKVRQEMMRTTSLSSANGGDFRKVEVDNDVDPEQFRDFEKAYHEVSAKLPKSLKEKMPDLRIRKLGKHGSASNRVNGLFNPAYNAVAIDVRTSEAFLHEMGHHYDLVGNNNASTSKEFRSIVKDYSAGLEETDAKRRQYYTTPTEVWARLSERYFNERLGIDNRLLNSSKFGNDDYAAFDRTPGLKERGFAILDRMYYGDEGPPQK